VVAADDALDYAVIKFDPTKMTRPRASWISETMAISRNSPAKRLQSVTVKRPFEAVVVDHGRTVLRVCRAVGAPVDADDAWSETFLCALRAYPELPAEANIEAWLVTIAHRKAIDITRARTRHACPTDTVPETPSAPHHERDDDLAEALARLPTKQKQAVAYHYLADMPYSEVAAILGGSTDAARRAASDGIAALRRTYPGASPGTGTPGKGDSQ
jgi:RNA polymerase sigma factor (sigma-70 family)